MWLYQNRLLDLEKRYEQARQTTSEMRAKLAKADGETTIDFKAIKLELDILTVEVRLLKEQTAYYLKLDRFYDMAKLHAEFIEELRKIDPDRVVGIVERLNERWRTRELNRKSVE